MKKRYLFVSDFDETLSVDDNGELLSAKLGISAEDFACKIEEIKRKNIVQLGGELAHLLIRDPDYIGRVTREVFYEVGREVKLKKNVPELIKILNKGIKGYEFSVYVLSAAPQEIVEKALEGMLPPENIFGTTFVYDKKGVLIDVARTGAGHAKVATLDELKMRENVPRDAIIYVGDGSSDIHVMLHILSYKGYPITVSPAPYMGHICRRTVISDNILSILIPILTDILNFSEAEIRKFFEARGHTIQEWNRAKTEWVEME